MIRRIEATVTGRVQFVMFRDYVKRGARRLGIRGWVRNNSDGTVSVVAEGEEEDLRKLVARMRIGSLLSRVDEVREVWMEPLGQLERFSIVYE